MSCSNPKCKGECESGSQEASDEIDRFGELIRTQTKPGFGYILIVCHRPVPGLVSGTALISSMPPTITDAVLAHMVVSHSSDPEPFNPPTRGNVH